MLWHAADEYIKYYLHQFDLNIDILLEIAPLKYLYFFKILKSSTFLGISMTTVLIFHINPDLTKQTPTASLLYNLPTALPGEFLSASTQQNIPNRILLLDKSAQWLI